MKIFMCISAKLLQHLRSRECNILIASPQAELSFPDRIPVRGGENFYVHLRKRDREPK